MKKSLFFVVLITTLINSSYASVDVLSRASTEEVADIVAWIKHNEEYLVSPSLRLACQEGAFYKVDINNDGHDEYVFLEPFRFLNLRVYKKYPCCDEYDEIEIPRLKGEPFSVGNAFINPLTNKEELFVKAQGKVYMCGGHESERGPEFWRDIYLWENDTVTPVCDNFWIQEQRNFFKQLYKQGQYNFAYQLLFDFEEKFRSGIDPQKDLWLRNDIALAALKNQCPFTALSLIDQIKKEVSFAQAKPALKNAVACNESLCIRACEEEKRAGLKESYDYSWLLAHHKESFNAVIPDDKKSEFFSAVVPDITGNFNGMQANERWLLKNSVQDYFFDENIEVADNRYIMLFGYMPRCGLAQVFIWCDAQEKVSVLVFGGQESDRLEIVSRSIDASDLRPEFLDALKRWMQKNTITATQAPFYDRSGNIVMVAV